jgi:hypothetical protein
VGAPWVFSGKIVHKITSFKPTNSASSLQRPGNIFAKFFLENRRPILLLNRPEKNGFSTNYFTLFSVKSSPFCSIFDPQKKQIVRRFAEKTPTSLRHLTVSRLSGAEIFSTYFLYKK